MKKDRSYYRAMTHNELREQAAYGIDVDWKELAIALTERLDTIRAEVYAEFEIRENLRIYYGYGRS